jgi:hypothetical protein
MLILNRLRVVLTSLLLILVLTNGLSQQPRRPVFQGQPPVQPVETTSRSIEKQVKKTVFFGEDGVSFSNQFDGARLTKIDRNSAYNYKILITPENAPVNMSPWYAFQVWSKKKKEIFVTLTYPDFAKHRYTPLVSMDGKNWKPLETERITEEEKGTTDFGPESRPLRAILRLKVYSKPLWVSAQELQNSTHVFAWMNKLARKKKFSIEEIGKSTEGRPLRMLKIGNLESKKMIFVISRQHPPEVTGYFAMQAFVEKIADKSQLSKKFRRNWAIYVVPLMNPDGVDNGHWRHNAGGIDLNRDWAAFNQPETIAVRNFLQKREAETGGKFYFGIDFHSTWDDIYYPMDKKFTDTNMPNLVWDWLENIKKAIPNYEPNIRPNTNLEPTVVSRNYFLKAHKMEAIVFEIGDNTNREFIRKKGETGAIELMKLILSK